MADTQKTVAALLALMPHQDLRDFITSLSEGSIGCIGGMEHTTSTNVTITTANVFTAGIGTPLATGQENNFAVSGNKMTYSGTATRDVMIHYGMAVGLGASANNNVSIGLTLNDALVTRTVRASREIKGAVTTVPLSGHTIVEMANGDYVKLEIRNDDATTNLVVNHADLTAIASFAE